MIVPIDSSPTWLLAKQIDSIRFDVETDFDACKKFSILNVMLQRRAATRAH